MKIKLHFSLIGGANLGLEKSWKIVEYLIKNYPLAKWKKIIDWRKREGKYVVEIKEF